MFVSYTDINDCADVTCNGNGQCTDLVADYRCDCYTGFTGHECETSKLRLEIVKMNNLLFCR